MKKPEPLIHARMISPSPLVGSVTYLTIGDIVRIRLYDQNNYETTICVTGLHIQPKVISPNNHKEGAKTEWISGKELKVNYNLLTCYVRFDFIDERPSFLPDKQVWPHTEINLIEISSFELCGFVKKSTFWTRLKMKLKFTIEMFKIALFKKVENYYIGETISDNNTTETKNGFKSKPITGKLQLTPEMKRKMLSEQYLCGLKKALRFTTKNQENKNRY